VAGGGIQLVAANGGWAVIAGGCKWWLSSLTF